MSALRHKFDIFRAAIDTTDEALRETYTDLVGLSHSLSRLVVGVGKLTKQPASLKEAFTSFMEQGLKFAFSGVETGSKYCPLPFLWCCAPMTEDWHLRM